MNKNKYTGLIAFVILIIGFGLCYYFSERNNNKLKTEIIKDAVLTSGIVSAYLHDYKGISEYEYYFSTNENMANYYSKSSSSSSFVTYAKIGKKVLNKSFPVIYNKSLPQYNKILIIPDDFKEYNIPFPDSLNWVKEILDE